MDEAEATRIAYERQGVRWQDESYRSWSPGNLFVLQELERTTLEMLRKRSLLPLDDREILDVGCGAGKQLLRFLSRGARPDHLHGIDLQEDLVERARSLAPHVDFRAGDATALPFDDASLDIVLAFTMLSSMRSSDSRTRAAGEMKRVVRSSGAILVYDFGFNPRNPEVQSVGRKELARLFGDWRIESRRITLAPPIVRAVAPRSWLACSILSAIPLLRTHRFAMITAPR